jgi:hypothetical protein
MSLEIDRGYARLLMDYGSGTVSVEQRQIKLTDGKSHRVDILWSRTVSRFSVRSRNIQAVYVPSVCRYQLSFW